MKKLILSIAAALIVSISQAQINKKDTVMPDTNQVEKIHKMPMDTMPHNRPAVPLTPKDTVINRKSIDDADPKKSESPK
ncbi:MAG TPA: hypothetical protein VJY62_08185 [Bacteroidia bacterium]|nr:hypothetical protein [Bacteroidia bacterium]